MGGSVLVATPDSVHSSELRLGFGFGLRVGLGLG